MRARGINSAAVLRMTVAAALVSAAALPVAAEAKKDASTGTSSTSLTSTTSAATTADCRGGSHVSGGGFAVAPAYNPPANSGLRSLNQVSQPSGRRAWTAAGGGFPPGPVIAGSFTAYARCESNSLGKVAVRSSSSITVGPSTGQNTELSCPHKTHVLYGGYGTTAPYSQANPSSSRLFVVQSRRTSRRVWTISAFNPSTSQSTTLSTYFACERDGNAKIGSVTRVVPVVDNGRTAADATCSKRKHLVGGGFLISPAIFPGTVPLVSIDQDQPVGDRTWHLGAYEFPEAPLPAGSSLTTVAYCR